VEALHIVGFEVAGDAHSGKNDDPRAPLRAQLLQALFHLFRCFSLRLRDERNLDELAGRSFPWRAAVPEASSRAGPAIG